MSTRQPDGSLAGRPSVRSLSAVTSGSRQVRPSPGAGQSMGRVGRQRKSVPPRRRFGPTHVAGDTRPWAGKSRVSACAPVSDNRCATTGDVVPCPAAWQAVKPNRQTARARRAARQSPAGRHPMARRAPDSRSPARARWSQPVRWKYGHRSGCAPKADHTHVCDQPAAARVHGLLRAAATRAAGTRRPTDRRSAQRPCQQARRGEKARVGGAAGRQRARLSRARPPRIRGAAVYRSASVSPRGRHGPPALP